MPDAIAHETIPITRLFPHKRNYRSHPPAQIAQLKASLQRFSQVRSVVVADDGNEHYTILAGHGVIEAAMEAGIVDLRCDIVPAGWSQSDRDAYLVADNMHSQNASDDDTLLAALLQEQQDAGFDLAALGTDDEALRQMLASLGDAYQGAEEEAGADQPEPSGNLLALLDITIADPRHTVVSGDIWTLGPHTLIVAHVFKDWSIWTRYLKDPACLFLPFPGPMVALSDKAEIHRMVLVQPDTYIAGHILDRYADIHGEKSVKKSDQVQVSLPEEDEELQEEGVDE